MEVVMTKNNFAENRMDILLAAAAIFDDQTVVEDGIGEQSQLETDTFVSQRLRQVALTDHVPEGPIGGTGARLRLNPNVNAALLRYLNYLTIANIHCVKVSIGDEGEVTWRERGDAMLREFKEGVDFSGAEVLNIGLNSGGDMAALLDAGAIHVVGLDMMPQLTAFTSALMVMSDIDPSRWTVVTGNCETWVCSRQFDIVYHVGVLYHVENPVAALRNAFYALKPGGWLALETEIVDHIAESGGGNKDSWPENNGRKDDIAFWPLYEPEYVGIGKNWPTWFILSERVVRSMLEAVGFTDIKRLPSTVAKSAFIAKKPI
jgi:2-polyprenyl-3-methyl-5-hydroxy-6-metoxy-1,4-benzoquinol methylase